MTGKTITITMENTMNLRPDIQPPLLYCEMCTNKATTAESEQQHWLQLTERLAQGTKRYRTLGFYCCKDCLAQHLADHWNDL
jgi:hypothetical protein